MFLMNETIKAGYLAALDLADSAEDLNAQISAFIKGYADDEDIAAKIEERRRALSPEHLVNLDELTAAELMDVVTNRDDLRSAILTMLGENGQADEDEEEDEDEDEQTDSEETTETPEDQVDDDDQTDTEEESTSAQTDEEETGDDAGKEEDEDEKAPVEPAAFDANAFVDAFLTEDASFEIDIAGEQLFVKKEDKVTAEVSLNDAFQAIYDRTAALMDAQATTINTLREISQRIGAELNDEAELSEIVTVLNERINTARPRTPAQNINTGTESLVDSALLNLFGHR